MKAILTTALVFFALGIFAAEIPKAPIPPSPYLPIIYKFADAMLERGRTTNGLFYSALDRIALAPLTNRPPAPAGVREEDRSLVCNSQHHQNFLRLLYTLSELSGKPKYRDAADAELRWFLESAEDFSSSQDSRPWMLWERSFAIAPKASEKLARSLVDKKRDSARYTGFDIRAWAVAYAHTKDEAFLAAIARSAAQVQDKSDMGLAIDCDAAARLIPAPLASRLQPSIDWEKDSTLAAFADSLKSAEWLMTDGQRLPLYGAKSVARAGMICVSRYENTGRIGYRALVHAAADAYLESVPPQDADLWPVTFGHVISLQVAAWRSTAQQVYLDRARALADFAVKNFFDQGPLPRASLKSNHYEAITGADTLALGLVELHLHILAITAVRYPPNTIDR